MTRTILMTLLISCTIVEALQSVRPGGIWTLSGSDYSGLVWQDKTTEPTQAEVNQAISDCQTQGAILTTQKTQAILDAKNTLLAPQTRLDALIKAIDLK